MFKNLFRSLSVTDENNDNSKIHTAKSADKLIRELKLEPQIQRIKRSVSLQNKSFEVLYSPAINSFMELVQLMPASESYHHAENGGMIKHTLSVIEYAVHERRKHTLPIAGTPEEIESQKFLWTYTIFTGALLHDVGKVCTLVDFITQSKGASKIHNVYGDALAQNTQYQLRFKQSNYSLHDNMGASFYYLLPKVGRGFIASNLDIYAELLAFLRKDRANWGSVGEIVQLADMKSTAESLGLSSGDRKYKGAVGNVAENLGQNMMTALRLAIRKAGTKKNIPGAALWVKDNYTYAVAKTVAELIKHEMHEFGMTNIPSDNSRIFDELAQYGFIHTSNNEAIHRISVSNQSFDQKFTVLKFDTNKLFSVKTLPKPFEGQIYEISEAEFKSSRNSADDTPFPETGEIIGKSIPEPEESFTASLAGADESSNNVMPAPVTQEEAAFEDENDVNTDEIAPLNETSDDLREIDITSASHGDVVNALAVYVKDKLVSKEIVINRSSSPVNIVKWKDKQYLAIVSPRFFIEFGTTVCGMKIDPTVRDSGLKIAQAIQKMIHLSKTHTPNYGNFQIHKYGIKNSPKAGKQAINVYLFSMDSDFCKRIDVEKIIGEVKENTNLIRL